MIKLITGDMLEAPLDAFMHQANCFCTMGSGVAKSVREKYPEVYAADCKTVKGDKTKLGTFSFAHTHDAKIGYNLYSQYDFGHDGKQYTNYDAMRTGFIAIKKHLENIIPFATLGMPCRMGCTRGGGNWILVLAMVYEIFDNTPLTVVVCEFKEYSSTPKTQYSNEDINKLKKGWAEFQSNESGRFRIRGTEAEEREFHRNWNKNLINNLKENNL